MNGKPGRKVESLICILLPTLTKNAALYGTLLHISVMYKQAVCLTISRGSSVHKGIEGTWENLVKL